MKHLRRRTASTSTPSTSNQPSISVSSPAPLGSPHHADAEPPLYARFTGTRRGQDGLALKPLVSGPIALAPRKLVQVPVSVAVPAAPALKQQRSRDERERRAEREAAEKARNEEEKERGGEERGMGKAKSRPEMRRGEEFRSDAPSRAGEDTTRKHAQVNEQEVRRMPSEGAAPSGQSESGVGLGRHGTRIDGDRVLLPARKVTRKRAESDAAVTGAGPAKDVLIEENAQRQRAHERREGSSGETQRRAKEESGRVDGERVLLPARKVTHRKAEDAAPLLSPSTSASTLNNIRPSLESSRNDSQGTSSTTSSSRPFKETRAKIPGRASNETQKPVAGASSNARTSPRSEPCHSRPQASSSSPVAFPSTSTASSARSPAGAASGEQPSTHAPEVSSSGPGAGMVVIVDPEDGGEDRFSKPKRSRLNTIATTTPASATASVSAPPLAASASTGSAPSHVPPISASAKPSVRDPQQPLDVIDRQRSIDVGESSSSAPSTTPKPQPTSTAGAVTSSASTSSPASSASARPPRRRKYSLLAAFGLRGGNTSESERERDVGRASERAGQANEGAGVVVQSAAKAPPPPSSLPAATTTTQGATSAEGPSGEQRPTPLSALESVLSKGGSDPDAHHRPKHKQPQPDGVHSSSGVPRDRQASPVPPSRTAAASKLQLQSLHLSGFDFPLDALLASSDDADRLRSPTAALVPPPVPPFPHSHQPLAPPPDEASNRSLEPTKREAAPGINNSSANSHREQTSPSDPPVASEGDHPIKPATAASKPSSPSTALPRSKANINQDTPAPSPSSHSSSPSPTRPPPAQKLQKKATTAGVGSAPARSSTETQQRRGNPLAHIARTIDLDHSLLPPESDTRYPIPRRRSPTNVNVNVNAHNPASSSSDAPSTSTSRSHSSPARHKTNHDANASAMPPNSPSATLASQPYPSPPLKHDQHVHRGPVQGRPLIFAAMAAAEAEKEILEPQAWMAVATLDSDHSHTSPITSGTPRLERSDGSSQFVNGYPTPRSASPLKSPELKEKRGKVDHVQVTPAMTRRATAANASASQSPPLAPKGLPTPPESHPQSPSPPSSTQPRTHKLTKSRSRVTRVADPAPTSPSSPPQQQQSQKYQQPLQPKHASQPPPPFQQQPQRPGPQPVKAAPSLPLSTSTTLGAKPPTPVEDDAPPPPPPPHGRSRDGPSRHAHQTPTPIHAMHTSSANVDRADSALLGSPIQLRSEKPLPERRSTESVRSPPPQQRVISSESAVPTRPVKVLTERQMEKLNATKGIVASSAASPSTSTSRQRHDRQHQHQRQQQYQRQQPPQHQQETVVIDRTPPPQSQALPAQNGPSTSPARESRSRMDVEEMPAGREGSGAPASPRKQRSAEKPKPAPVVVDSAPIEPQSPPQSPRSPVSPENYAQARTRRRGKALEKSRPEGIESVAPAADPEVEPIPEPYTNASQHQHDPEAAPDTPPEEPEEPTYYPLAQHLTHPALLAHLLDYLTFSDWLTLSAASKAVRERLWEERDLSEPVLERFLRTIGYRRWAWGVGEEVVLTLTDLNAYMHGVSIPPHQWARYAEAYLQTEHRDRDRTQRALIQSLQAACRSYTRVVLRLRAQAEAEARATGAGTVSPPTSPHRGRGLPSVKSATSVNNVPLAKKSFSQSSSRAPSPTSSHSHAHSFSPVHTRSPSAAVSVGGGTFNSPLFRLRRAPLLQVFVPSPEGEWLSDASVIECEKELGRAGVLGLLRPGDVVWDAAVGDEGNVGRMVWDGSYLIDLDYTYSRVGDLPKYLPTLAFPPSYFHRVVRTMGSGNPICHIDIAPWSEEIAANLQLLQDRMKAETPQGGHHMVVRWVHRSSFTIRPPSGGKPLRATVPRDVGPGPGPGGAWFVDPGWYGTVVVEAEGTNEGLADLQARCRGAFPPRISGPAATAGLSPERAAREEAQRCVFRIMREKSRPGEIWLKTVTDKERLLPP